MTRGEIERSLRQQYARKIGDNIVNLNAFRMGKVRMEAAKQARIRKDITGMARGLTDMTNMMKANAAFVADWNEMDRIFNDLFEMGAIPEVRVSYAN